MPYLVAKDCYRRGCYAVQVQYGSELVELKQYLRAATSSELVVISCPAAYSEYAPYTIVKDQEEFIRLVLQMRPCQEMKLCQADEDDVMRISKRLIEKNRTAYETLAK